MVPSLAIAPSRIVRANYPAGWRLQITGDGLQFLALTSAPHNALNGGGGGEEAICGYDADNRTMREMVDVYLGAGTALLPAAATHRQQMDRSCLNVPLLE